MRFSNKIFKQKQNKFINSVLAFFEIISQFVTRMNGRVRVGSGETIYQQASERSGTNHRPVTFSLSYNIARFIIPQIMIQFIKFLCSEFVRGIFEVRKTISSACPLMNSCFLFPSPYPQRRPSFKYFNFVKTSQPNISRESLVMKFQFVRSVQVETGKGLREEVKDKVY